MENEEKVIYEHTLTPEQIIANIEQAPKEMQTMVAKAYIREDICDDDVQYLFNTDTIEELNDSAENSEVEHINADDVKGIGAVGFTMRTSKPSGNKNFITTGSGGWNTCIKGYPMDANANVLANCVGYASGRFNEIINIARDTAKCTYKTLNCNAVGFIERAQAAGLKTGSTPKRGAIMCWGNGSAGHVAIVEKVNSNNSVYTSESGYGSTAFWNQTRTNSNGRWGCSGSYYFRAFIYLPDDVQKAIDGGSTPTPTPTPTPSKSIDEVAREVIRGDWGNGDDRKKRLEAAGYNYSEVQAKVNEILNGNKPAPTPAPAPSNKLKVGDKVKIIGTGNGSSYGTSNTAYGIGWSRQILRIWSGRAFPYQVGNASGTTGFYKAEALQRQ